MFVNCGFGSETCIIHVKSEYTMYT